MTAHLQELMICAAVQYSSAHAEQVLNILVAAWTLRSQNTDKYPFGKWDLNPQSQSSSCPRSRGYQGQHKGMSRFHQGLVLSKTPVSGQREILCGTHHSPSPGVSPLIKQFFHTVHMATGSCEDEGSCAILWENSSTLSGFCLHIFIAWC